MTNEALSSVTSAFLVPTQAAEGHLGIWAEAGQALELAYRAPIAVGPMVRAIVALALAVSVKLIIAGLPG
jgi:hypothetical protein